KDGEQQPPGSQFAAGNGAFRAADVHQRRQRQEGTQNRTGLKPGRQENRRSLGQSRHTSDQDDQPVTTGDDDRGDGKARDAPINQRLNNVFFRKGGGIGHGSSSIGNQALVFGAADVRNVGQHGPARRFPRSGTACLQLAG